MKKKKIISLLVTAMFLTSCDLIETDVIVTLSESGFYTARYSTSGKTLTVDVTNELTDTDALLVINVDEVSDTIKDQYFTKKYSLSSGSHTLSVEAGRKIEGGEYSLYVDSKTSTTIKI